MTGLLRSFDCRGVEERNLRTLAPKRKEKKKKKKKRKKKRKRKRKRKEKRREDF